VYRSSGTAWSFQTKIIAKDGYTWDAFGSGVSVYGTTAMIGACIDDDKGASSGIIYYIILFQLPVY
jgi:predicted permease